ncbi:hypothetical protein [Demequina lignilytica]|uniref:Uncharacterized protein n=1 Tax=Demequina lignilytica TaxID=3051663 RepID=A0AB35MJM1_9MICO|nr:hypothetical protein [Demequina sp. SYSU T0a273]MDN4483947.1 hypothetical protein [Demequina sp. SYSU T0a273]
MECVEWEERARADRPSAPVRRRRGRAVLAATLGTVAVVALAVLTAL